MSITLKAIPISNGESAKRLMIPPVAFLESPAHPIWSRIIWRTLEASEKLNTQELMDSGVSGQALWSDPNTPEDMTHWTYGNWFSLYEYAYQKLGSHLPARLGSMMSTACFVYGEEILLTSPNLRSVFEFWDAKLCLIDPLSEFTIDKVRGGLKISVAYPLSGHIETYFATGALSMINVAHFITTGTWIKEGVRLNIPERDNLKTVTESLCKVVIDSYKPSPRGSLTQPKRKAQLEITISDKMLDRTSPSCDAVRHLSAMRHFDRRTAPLNQVEPSQKLPHLVESIQLTALAPMTVVQMAEKIGMSESAYRRGLSDSGTSHKQIQKSCIAYNVKSLRNRGCSRSEIVEKTGIEARRLDRMLRTITLSL